MLSTRISACFRIGEFVALIYCFCLPAWGAGPTLCGFGVVDTLKAAFTPETEAPESGNGPRLAKSAADTALLSLVVVAACPDAAERVIHQDQSGAASWMGSLKGHLESSLPPDLISPTLGVLINGIHCTSSTPGLCALRKRLRELLGSGSSNAVGHDLCESLGPVLTENITYDLIAADGAVIDRTHDLATILSFCPTPFFAFMHSHQRERDIWLQQADRFLFWGDSTYRGELEAYRRALISHVTRSIHQNGFTDEKKEVLSHFWHTKVTVSE